MTGLLLFEQPRRSRYPSEATTTGKQHAMDEPIKLEIFTDYV
jgi:hypothetical protein